MKKIIINNSDHLCLILLVFELAYLFILFEIITVQIPLEELFVLATSIGLISFIGTSIQEYINMKYLYA